MFPAFEHVPAYPLVFPLFWGAMAVFGLVLVRHIRVMQAARPGGPRGLDQVGRRAFGLVRFTILQVRMFRQLRVGVMHYLLFLGSTILLIGNANVVTGGLLQAVVSWPLNGFVWAFLAGVQNAVAVGALLGAAYAFERRLISRPSRLNLSRTGLIILAMITGVVSTEFIAQAFEAARFGAVPGAWAADAIAIPLGGLTSETLEAGFVALWWAHIVLVSAFLVYIPFNKHFHVYVSFANVWFRKLQPRGELPALDLEAEDATFGLRTLQDLGWKDMLDGFTCTECGRCTEACPAWNTGKPLNPRSLIMGIRSMAEDAETGINFIPNSPIVREAIGRDDRFPDPAKLAAPIVGNAIPYDAVWDCVTCGACVEACPVLIEHVDKIVGLRRNLVLEDSRFPSELNGAFRNMEGVGNPWGQPPTSRLDWTKGLGFEVPIVADVATAGKLGDLDVLYWVGCAASFDERNRKVARAFATCMDAAGITFAVLGQEESCTGDPARRMGNDYVYQMLASSNIETLNRYRMGEKTIVTACPHCFNSIGNEYRQLGGNFRVLHHSAFLKELIADGRLRVLDEDDGPRRSVTLHDSCYMARYNDVVAEPRDVLGAVPGLDLVEMDKNGKNAFCCGAGGGRMWMEETRGTRINASRTDQALATGAGTVATECPFCMTMMKDGLEAAAGNEAGTVRAIDIAELLAESLAPVLSGRQLPVLQ
jgi:Fe-S oxidoreductase/nitrate reductase gamma subunit